MGMDRFVAFAGPAPSWDALRARLAEVGAPAQIRMIDGQLAFPDEVPPDDWRELRLGLPSGMVTLRRAADGIATVVWGNADASLVREWQAVADALASLTGGSVRNHAEGDAT